MKVLALVPIKTNNERLPNKNTLKFCDDSNLIERIQNTLLKVSLIDEIYIFCSDENIKTHIVKGVKFLRRPKELDSNTTTSNEIISNFINNIEADIYILAHATSPFLKVESVEKGLKAILSNDFDSALTVTKSQEFMWINNKPFNYDLTKIPRTQDLEPFYIETSGFFIFKKEVFTKMCRRIGEHPYLVEVDKIEAIDIDNLIDFEIADAIIKSKIK